MVLYPDSTKYWIFFYKYGIVKMVSANCSGCAGMERRALYIEEQSIEETSWPENSEIPKNTREKP